jgi:hypothetical protein
MEMKKKIFEWDSPKEQNSIDAINSHFDKAAYAAEVEAAVRGCSHPLVSGSGVQVRALGSTCNCRQPSISISAPPP